MSDEERFTDVLVALEPTIENPFPVRDSNGRFMGSAVVTLASGYFHIRFILDPHNPEAFDLTNDPARCRVSVDAILRDGVLSGTIILTSK